MVPIESFVTGVMIDEDLYSRYHKITFKTKKKIVQRSKKNENDLINIGNNRYYILDI